MIHPPEKVLQICHRLRRAGFEAWLVGGAVRDSIMGREPHDWDIASNARPDVVCALFERVVETGIKHGTVSVILDGEPFEVTTFRGDGAYTDGRRPDSVRFLDTIEQDLARRDFTVNAIAYDPIDDRYCDPFGGREDIDERRIKAVGVPAERFREDGLRTLRAARFCATLGFQIDPKTYDGMFANIEMLDNVAMERVQAEWAKGLLAAKPSRFLEAMRETCLLWHTAPEMAPMVGCTQNRYHQYDVWRHSMSVLDHSPPDIVLRLAAAFHDVSKPATKGVHPVTGEATFYDHENVGAGVTDGILERMRFPTEHRQRAVHLIRHHLVPYNKGMSGAAIRRWLRRIGGVENLGPLLQLARADIAGKGQAVQEMNGGLLDELERRISEMAVLAPIVTNTTLLAINGSDVMNALGIPPGKRVGEVLRALLEAVTDEPELNTRERLLERVQVMA